MVDPWAGVIDHNVAEESFYKKGKVTKFEYDLLANHQSVHNENWFIQDLEVIGKVYPEVKSFCDYIINKSKENKEFDLDGLSKEDFKAEIDRYNLFTGAIKILSSYAGNTNLLSEEASLDTLYNYYLDNGAKAISKLLDRYSQEHNLKLMSLCIFGEPQKIDNTNRHTPEITPEELDEMMTFRELDSIWDT